MSSWVKKFILREKVLLFIVLIIMTMIFVSPYFATLTNLNSIILQISIPGVIAMGMTFVLVLGNFDLSVGSVMYFTSMVAIGTEAFLGFAGSILLAIFTGFVIGLINGLLISKAKINAFIVTLGMMNIIHSISLLINNQQPFVSQYDNYKGLGNGSVLGIPYLVIIFFIIVCISQFVLGTTKTGRRIYATGGNEEVSKLAGINVDYYKIFVFAISGLCAGMAGVMLASRLSTGGPPMVVDDTALTAIASAVVGGTSLSGGKGGAVRTLVGVLLMGILFNGLNLMQIFPYLQYVIKGAIIVIIVFFDGYYRERPVSV